MVGEKIKKVCSQVLKNHRGEVSSTIILIIGLVIVITQFISYNAVKDAQERVSEISINATKDEIKVDVKVGDEKAIIHTIKSSQDFDKERR